MQDSRIRLGLSAGFVAAAATTGALLGFGLRQGMPSRPFNVAASVILGEAAAGSWGFHRMATPVGLALHISAVVALGMLAAVLATKSRRLRTVGASVIVSFGAAILHLALLGRDASSTRALTIPQLIVVYLLMGVGLMVGMRLARSSERIDYHA